MFTGIIRNLGTVALIIPESQAAQLTIRSVLAAHLQEGDSVAVNGACLTALTADKDSWTVRLMQETLQKTNLGDLVQDSFVNLELPVAAGQRFDGHFVLGHIDGVADVKAIERVGSDKVFTFKPPVNLLPYLIQKGSVALDGVSLTVVDVAQDSFTVSMMPYTLEHTTFGQTHVGSRVNIEVDFLGKYVESILAARTS